LPFRLSQHRHIGIAFDGTPVIVPSGPASTLLRVIAMEPQTVLRALDPRRSRLRATTTATG
jgi:hypothetical protein